MERDSVVDTPTTKPNQTYLWISIILKDGSIITPAIFVDGTDPFAEQHVIDASEYFEEQYKWKWIVEVNREQNLSFLFTGDITEVVDWQTYKNNLFVNDSNEQVAELIKNLNKEWISANVIKEVKTDLDFERNEALFREYVELLIEDESKKAKTLEALDLAIKAHKWQTQKRPKDKKWLDSIPYVNHPIRIALWALVDLKLTPEEVQAFLLHDVVEDTDVDMQYMLDNFSKTTTDILYDVTKLETESRADFMNRVNNLTNKISKLLKCLDRYHNLIRGFGINDKKYLKKYIKETEEVYLSKFMELAEDLWPLFLKFYDVFEQFKIHCDMQKDPE